MTRLSAMQIIRGISLGLALMMYGQEEGSDGLTESMIHDQDPILRCPTARLHAVPPMPCMTLWRPPVGLVIYPRMFQ